MTLIVTEQDTSLNKPDTPEVSAPETVAAEAPKGARTGWLAVLSLLVTVAAWIVANINGYVAVAISAAAIVLGAIALRSKRHLVRNTAITSIIAAGVLMVVLAAFIIVIYLGLR